MPGEEKTPKALLKCKNQDCNKFKFAHDDSWEKVTDKDTISYFAKKVRAKEFVVYRIPCPDCTAKDEGIYVPSEHQPGDFVSESSPRCEKT